MFRLDEVPVQLFITALLACLTGPTFSLNVFTLPIERSDGSSNVFDGVWPFAIGLFFFLSAPAMAFCGYLLNGTRDHASTLRRMGFASAAGYLMLAVLGPPAVATSSPVLLVLSLAPVAVPLAALSVLIVDHAERCCPGSVGIAVAFITVALGIGTVVSAWAFELAVTALSVGHALFLSAVGLAVLTAASTAMLRIPSSDVVPVVAATNASHGGMNESAPTEPLLTDAGVGDRRRNLYERLTPSRLVRLPSFWLYIYVIIAKRACFPLLPSFFRMGAVYGASFSTLMQIFQIGTVLSIIFNLVSSAVTDFARTRKGPLRFGARNIGFVMLVLQTVAFVELFFNMGQRQFSAWAVFMVLQRLLTQSHFGLSTLLAADLFGPENLALSFGFGGGLALGAGEGLSNLLMMLVEQSAPPNTGPDRYAMFYVIGAIWSISGIIVLMLTRSNMRDDGVYIKKNADLYV